MTETPTTTAPPLPGLLYRQAAEYQARLEALDGQAEAVLRQAWGTAQQAITRDLDAFLARVTEARARGDRISPSWAMRETRYRALLATAAQQIATYTGTAQQVARSAQAQAQSMAVTSAASMGTAAVAQAGLAATFVDVNPANLRHLVGFTQDGSPLAALFDTLGPEALAGARTVLTHGITVGTGVAPMRRRLLQALDVPRWRAETIVRTETHRVFREASRETYAQNADLLEGWVWTAHLDSRTCPACIRMDGTLHPVGANLDGHPRCRCAMVPRTRLDPGQFVDSRPPIRSGMEWLKGQPATTQRAILGPAKFHAYRAGDIDLDDLVTRTDDRAWGTMRREATLAEAKRNAAARKRRPDPTSAAAIRARTDALAAQNAAQRAELARLRQTREQVAQAARQVEAITPPAPAPAAAERVLSAAQYETMRPARGGWSEAKRRTIVDTLSATPRGKVLADTLDRFQDGGSITRLRKNMERHLAGETIDPTSTARVEALLGAIRDAPTDWAPTTLYRGMSVPGGVDEVLAKYTAGDTLDLSLTSFSSDRTVARRFQDMTAKARTTRVMVEWVGPDKRALPIQDMPRDRRLHKEKEWVTAGRYRVVAAKRAPDGSVLLRIEQEGPL